ncbi:GNAT family N-acetyltransferase [Flagellimonas nanhaiensis]|uniref:N-acetyltransferase n=1 Tax=Flagellimonas nanhaiensis TaxID=2292706 RepID=A0A371JTI0_9FLAO|nr:GNAT family N-acetyltransferase [Allomuricauda nanhaiensis]RDY61069.1 N-acetyltransferase [Allomuricauda nanhaiensis]
MKEVLKTERLLVAEAVVEDAKFFKSLLNSPTWLKFIGDRGVKTERQAVAYITSNLIRSYKENGYGLYKICLKQSLEPIGVCGFLKRTYLESPDIGFALLPQFEGQGFMYEASKAMIHYGVNHLKINPILGITTSENQRSQRLLEKLGFNGSGTIKPAGSREELLLYTNKKSHSK